MPKLQRLIDKEMLSDEVERLITYFSNKSFTTAEATIVCNQFIIIATVAFAERHK